ncbi:hypothetical protein LPW26_03340 [Rhodopseudomonas sp. HC1]|uniref:hypothetical protein n=1 Tax=Rhodopseudomonas infernalis TaxID=2897386 RepID=UPI001EE87C4C|nr:hypothetical protein [Rhodopseudomonas infernalis]MCG6203660.1 hypothetical protein [Rhodopseudomonas infernalis]
MDRIISEIIEEVSELPDRTSPADQPDMMLVTADELEAILRDRLSFVFNETAQAAYRVCAETRHVTLGRSAANAIRAIGGLPQEPDTCRVWDDTAKMYLYPGT